MSIRNEFRLGFLCVAIDLAYMCREACRSILTFFQDILDVPTTFTGKHYGGAVDAVFLPRGATLTRILLAASAGALPESRLSEVRSVP